MEAKIPETYQGTLEKVTSNHQNLRTPTVTGTFLDLPHEGECFEMKAESLTSPGNGFRMIETTTVLTSQVLEASPERLVYEFATKNSTYRLTVDG